jgi:drug/metabolite transporter (DMT)-like permease
MRDHCMSFSRTISLTALTMIAFAGNSLFCRMALKTTMIDAASFTLIRFISGGFVLWLVMRIKQGKPQTRGDWLSAVILFIYAAGFSFAYIKLSAGVGALLLFGAVQATMILYGMWNGERFGRWQLTGLVLALAGLTGLLLPGLSAPPLMGSLLMLGAGVAWGAYSLLGKGATDPTAVTAGNFLRAIPVSAVLSIVMIRQLSLDGPGIVYAVLSGALTSGIGYAVWYSVLPFLKATQAATVQLSVPVLAALAGILFLDEQLSLRLVLASVAILGGIVLVIKQRNSTAR